VKCEEKRVRGQVCIITCLVLIIQLTALGSASGDVNSIDEPVEEKYPQLTELEILKAEGMRGRSFPGSVLIRL